MCNEYIRRKGFQSYASEFNQIRLPRVRPRDEDGVCFAGIWDRCDTTDAGTVESFTMLMRDAAAPLDKLHSRQPIILRREDWAIWLDLAADVRPLFRLDNGDRFAIERA